MKGNLPHNTKPIGYERISKDGYVEVKVKMRPSSPYCNDNFIPKHRLLWEAENGPVPKGHKLILRMEIRLISRWITCCSSLMLRWHG